MWVRLLLCAPVLSDRDFEGGAALKATAIPNTHPGKSFIAPEMVRLIPVRPLLHYVVYGAERTGRVGYGKK
jgi:hypothetical protein